MKTLIILIALLSLATIETTARKYRKASFEELIYTQDPFTVQRTSLDWAYIDGGVASDGITGPLPFMVYRGCLSDHEFRETLIFITDNLSEAYNH